MIFFELLVPILLSLTLFNFFYIKKNTLARYQTKLIFNKIQNKLP